MLDRVVVCPGLLGIHKGSHDHSVLEDDIFQVYVDGLTFFVDLELCCIVICFILTDYYFLDHGAFKAGNGAYLLGCKTTSHVSQAFTLTKKAAPLLKGELIIIYGTGEFFVQVFEQGFYVDRFKISRIVRTSYRISLRRILSWR